MNEIILRGQLRDISPSHTINGIEYEQANLITTRPDGKEDILSLKFKKYSNTHKDGDFVELIGNVRSYSQRLNDKNKVHVYVFTYFDVPYNLQENVNNKVILDGRICKIDELRTTQSGKTNIHFVIANNIISTDKEQKLNNYIPSVAWGKLAVKCSNLKISDKVAIEGELHSRTYKKILDNGEIEIKTAHELVVINLEIIND